MEICKVEEEVSAKRVAGCADGTTVNADNGSKERSFEESYALLFNYKKGNGHADVPKDYKEDPQLSRFVNQMRVLHDKSKLSREKQEKLGKLGFQFHKPSPRTGRWVEFYQVLKNHWLKKGTCRVPSDLPLSAEINKWCVRQRDLLVRGKLSPEREMKLLSIGFDFSLDSHNSIEGRRSENVQSLQPRPPTTGSRPLKKRDFSGSTVLQDPHHVSSSSVISTEEEEPAQQKKRRLESERVSDNVVSGATEGTESWHLFTERPPVGARIRRRYDIGGWFEGSIVHHGKGFSIIHYDDDEGQNEDEKISNEEAILGAVTYALHRLSNYPRPRVGTKVRKHYEEGWYEGIVVEQNEKESNVHFEDGEVECMSDEELQMCSAAYRLRHAPESCLDLASLGAPPTKRPPVGTYVRKKIGSSWRNGKVVYQDEKVSHIRYPTGTSDVVMSDAEVEVCAVAYEQYLDSKQQKHEVGTKIRRCLGDDWGDRKDVSRGTMDSRVVVEDGEEQELFGDELRTTAKAYKMSHAKKKAQTHRMQAKRVISLPANEQVAENLLTERILRGTRPPSESQVVEGHAGEPVSIQVHSAASAVKNKNSVVDKAPTVVQKSRRVKIGKRLRMHFEDGWSNGTVHSITKGKIVVKFDDGQEEEFSDDEELQVSIKAHKLNRSQQKGRPTPGTKIRKRFAEGWFEGAVVTTGGSKSYVLYADGDEEYLSDEEISIAALAYRMHHSEKAEK